MKDHPRDVELSARTEEALYLAFSNQVYGIHRLLEPLYGNMESLFPDALPLHLTQNSFELKWVKVVLTLGNL